MTDKPIKYRRHKDKNINDWTLKKEKLLRYWQEECKLYNWLYRQNVEWYQKTNKYMSIIAILLSAVTGTTLINQSGNTDSETDKMLFIIFGLLSIGSTFIQSVKEFMNYNGKISTNTLASRQNSSIVIDIEEQLNLSRHERINGKEFMKHIKTRKNEIIQNGPMIPMSSWKKLRNSIRKKQGLNFFNQNLFQNYLDQNVDYTKIDFNLDNQSSSSSSSEHSTSSSITLEVPKVDPTKLHNLSKLDINSKINNVSIITDTSLINNINPNDIQITNSDNISNYNNFEVGNLDFGNDCLVRSNSLNTLSGSEDEFLEDMKNNNVCMYELRNNINNEEINKHNSFGISFSNIANLLPSFLKGGKNGECEDIQLEGIIIDGNYVKSQSDKWNIKKDETKSRKLGEKQKRKNTKTIVKKQKKLEDKKIQNQLIYHTSFI